MVGSELGRTIDHIPLVFPTPITSIGVFVAVIVAFPLVCIRSPDGLPAPGLAVLTIDEFSAVRAAEEPSVAIAPPPLLSMLTASGPEPAGMRTWAPESVTVWGAVGGC